MSDQDVLLRKLAAADPFPVDARSHELPDAALELLEKIVTAPVEAPRPRRWRSPRWILAPVALALTALLVLIGLPRGSQAPANAAGVLRRTATVAMSVPEGSSGRYVYSKTQAAQLYAAQSEAGPWSVVLPSGVESWIAEDGSGRIRSVAQEPIYPGPRDRARWEAAGSHPFATGLSDQTFGPGELSFESLAGLPNDPAALLPILRDQVSGEAPPVSVAVFIRVAELLARSDASPELRAGLYRVAAELPGVDLLGDMHDPAGRAGTGVGMSFLVRGTKVQAVLVFDPQTSELLAQEEILSELAPWVDAQVGAVLSYTAYINSGNVDSTTARPSTAV